MHSAPGSGNGSSHPLSQVLDCGLRFPQTRSSRLTSPGSRQPLSLRPSYREAPLRRARPAVRPPSPHSALSFKAPPALTLPPQPASHSPGPPALTALRTTAAGGAACTLSLCLCSRVRVTHTRGSTMPWNHSFPTSVPSATPMELVTQRDFDDGNVIKNVLKKIFSVV